LAKRDIAIVARRQAALPVRFPVGNPHWQNRPPGGQRRLDQRRMKMQQGLPVGRRALGKNRDMLAARKKRGDLPVDDPRMPPAATAQEDRVVLRRQPADQRPAPDLFLGNEGRRQHGVDHVDVDPGNVVGDQQCAGNYMGQIGLDPDPERIEQSRRPAGLEAQTRCVAAQRKNAQRHQRPTGDQQRQAKQAEGADRKIGFVQSACPR